ncbi:rab-GTPase-TBC domain-containing protein [Russula ochroleuca]|uniref:Rab-GTPase-TBC domain-containing protein n=1 Tax=Russula ochroleuca TaxID=152965 RepID=A0A9P5K0Q2_9AGAM|nr:rab-GTPase-TBC domain-containing protein [Russula ochroleuca]
MITHSSQQPRKASQVKEILKKLEATASQSPPSTSSSPRSLRDSPRRQPQTDVKSEAEHNRGASRASQSSFDTLKIKPEVSPEQDSDQAGDGLPTGVPREAAAKPLEVSLRHSQPEGPPHPPVNRPASPTSGPNDQHTSPLDALLSPTTSSLPDTPSLPRDSVAESDLGEVRLNDDERFSTVSLNAAAARDSTVAVKSPIDEGAPKPWTEEDEPPPAPSEVPSASSMRASFLLQRLGNDVTSGPRRSLDGQQKLQEVFERAQRHSRDLEDEASVDWAFWGSVVSDYQAFASENSEQLARAIERGIPTNLRGMVWQLMSASKDPQMEASYLKFLKESSPHEKAITRDLGRTFPQHEFFTDGQGIGQENLFNVLKAYSIYDPQVGYCQGLPFVVAILLLNMPDEEAFCLLVRLMYTYDLRGHFLPEMPKLQLRLFQFDRLIEEQLPVLHVHFLRQGVKSSMFCSQWFLTLFSYRFPLEIVFRIFDNCLASGIEAIFGFALSLLQKNEAKLLSLKFDELVAFLNTGIIDTYKNFVEEDEKPTYRVGDFVNDAMSLRITPFMLDSYSHEYQEMIRVRDAHAAEMDALRSHNRQLSVQINTLEASLASLNQEHVDILNELVRARLQNDELEGELVRYKLLYAEAVHQTEDAMSSHRLSTMSSAKGGSKRPSLSSLLSR